MRIAEALTLGALHELSVHILEGTSFLESIHRLDDIVDLVQEPLMNGVSILPKLNSAITNLIDLGQFVNLVDVVLLVKHRIRNSK